MYLFPLIVFYNPDCISNILALIDVTSQFRATMDTNNKPSMFVHTGPDSVLNFYQCCEGLYYFDTSASNIFNPTINASSLLANFQENTIFHISEIKGANDARILQSTIGFPSSTKFKIIGKVNQLWNWPTTVSDIDRADSIYGFQFFILKEKYVRIRPGQVENISTVPIPLSIENEYKNTSILIK